jgi:amidase
VDVTDESLVGRTATELSAAVREGRVSAVEVTRAHLDQLAAVEHRLGAYVTVLRQEALDAAARIDARPDRFSLPLAGVPVAVKDVAAVAGQPTRHGSLGTSAEPARSDVDVVARWRAAGAVIVGITRCPELSLWGSSDDHEGTAVSPWRPDRTAGGSSGGAAAAVAGGTAALALATDGLGSIRIPAACCGLVGIKPGADLVPERHEDGSRYWFGMSRFGSIATSVGDAALGLATMSGVDDLADVTPPERPLRVAVSWASPAPGLVVVARPWIEAAIEAGRLLRHAGHRVVHDDPPYEPATAGALLLRWPQAAAEDVRHLVEDRSALQPRTATFAALGERLAERFPVTDAQAARWYDRVAPLLEDHDVLVTPMFARTQPTARRWHRHGWLANVLSNAVSYPFALVWNLADVPAATVPVGTHAGGPTAVQIVGRRGSEATVLAVAAELERLAPWPRYAPAWGIAAA